MVIDSRYAADVEAILSHRHDGGADYWTTPDRRLLKGTPFSAYTSAQMLLELGMPPSEPILTAVAEMFLDAWREDGRFKLYPSGAIYPCHTVLATDILCRLGYATDPRVQATLEYLLNSMFTGGGWRCNKFSYGRGPETNHANPMPTLVALNAFRYSPSVNHEPALDAALDFLLEHWTTRTPIGPCHYGIGSRFMQISYPLTDYSLFPYVYILSFYDRARRDDRFHEALAALRNTLVDGKIVVQRVSPMLAGLTFCRRNQPSELATSRYEQILTNLRGAAPSTSSATSPSTPPA